MLHSAVNSTINFNKMVMNCVLLLFIMMGKSNFRGKSLLLKCLVVNISQNILCENENGNDRVLKTKQYTFACVIDHLNNQSSVQWSLTITFTNS